MTQDAPGASIDTENYRSVWMYLKEVEFRQGFVDLEVNGATVRTRYAEAGSPNKPHAVLLHGTGGHWETFAPNLGVLSEHFHCVAIDLIGNGFSDKPDYDYEIPVYVEHVLKVMDHFGIADAHLVGMSLGAWVASTIAVQHPDRVSKVILMSPAGKEAAAANMARIRAERTKAVNEPTWESLYAVFAHLIADESNRLPDLIGLRRAIYQRDDTRETIDHLLILQDATARDRNLIPEEKWKSISAPVMVVASGRDHGVYQDTANSIAQLIPRAEVFEMPSVRHWPHFEDPESFNAAAVAFLTK
ncbi:alpha/beta hydrolase fold family protein [Mycolicibacterium hassiacum DSM 44199]|jgi:pimeloyl-ACP methyl ester carboxylesterase|uniref:Alpha/beta hydrolase fold family protein n=1 Tax=Mycolicibacterium hassiacum (strain DSM 44199 / CIP 105218 / JCM 12690 / 3849) TaxID=1122247 RepID=K5BCB9_MYCHD|nr:MULTISPECIES: alpha/beta hydrolase [Mycolicibacterium]EID15671.1 2-hydroxy-6-ketonona-2,4-dienedoic acid hydrolase [Mycolicibacterium phlei RIVM601174]EKF21402.1 alpha/beta hydrolase fold family protein [Mycolicibacterium hassiacum DSM 44199]MBF4191607.1 2-hydroxy-6-ketonona-2,4-dienedoic acid hydrolase [Mycolicibacterium phlei]MBX5485100.1 alpha/beta hydrolase [Mycolicibacterium hassiacum]MDA4087141.1 alpha/beta hydrolase [Mycolicibacterium hassiacum DSM 44199]